MMAGMLETHVGRIKFKDGIFNYKKFEKIGEGDDHNGHCIWYELTGDDDRILYLLVIYSFNKINHWILSNKTTIFDPSFFESNLFEIKNTGDLVYETNKNTTEVLFEKGTDSYEEIKIEKERFKVELIDRNRIKKTNT